MLDDPSFKQYLKEKWNNGHAMVPHPEGGGKLIEMLSAYTGYPAYRDFISGQYQEWLNQKHQFEGPDTLSSATIFNKMKEIYNQIPLEETEEMSSLDFHEMLLESEDLSLLEKAYLKIFGSEFASVMGALNGGSYLNEELFKEDFKSNQDKLKSWLKSIQKFQALPEIDQIQYKRLLSEGSSRFEFKANLDVDTKDVVSEIFTFKRLEDLNNSGINLNTIRENLSQLDRLNLKGNTKKQIEQLDKTMKGEPHDRFKVIDALAFMNDPIYLAKEDENLIREQLSLMDPIENKDEYSLLSGFLSYFEGADLLNLAGRHVNLNRGTKKTPVVTYNLPAKSETTLSDIILPNIHAELELRSHHGDVILQEATLSEGIKLILTGNSKFGTTLINSEGTGISYLSSNRVVNCDLHFSNPNSEQNNFFSEEVHKSRLSGDFQIYRVGSVEDTTIDNANCKIYCSSCRNNKIVNSTVQLVASNTIDGLEIKNSNITINSYDTSKSNIESSSIISQRLFFSEANIKKSKIMVKHDDLYDTVSLTGTISNSILENVSFFKGNEFSPDVEYFPMDLFSHISEPLHLNNVLIKKYQIEVPTNLNALTYVRSPSLILYDCRLHYKNNMPQKEDIERWNRIKSHLNIEMYDADPFPQLSKGVLSIKDLINHSGDLEDVFEYHIQSPESLIEEITNTRHEIDKLEKDLEIKEDEKEQIALKNEIKRLEDVVETKEDLLNNPETSEIEFRRYLEDMPELVFRSFMETYDMPFELKAKIQNYINDNHVRVGKNHTQRLNENMRYIKEYDAALAELERKNKV